MFEDRRPVRRGSGRPAQGWRSPEGREQTATAGITPTGLGAMLSRLRDPSAAISTAVDVQGVVKSFGEVLALNGLDLHVEAGTVFGLLGPNSAGKTTLVRILAALLEPTAGRASVHGHDVASDPLAVRRRIGLAGQFAAVDEELTGRENVEMVGRLITSPGPRRALAPAKCLIASGSPMPPIAAFRRTRAACVAGLMLARRSSAGRRCSSSTSRAPAWTCARDRSIVVSIAPMGGVSLEFGDIPLTARDDVVLPEAVLARVERHALGVAAHRDALLAAGQHLKRGLLLYGPPGTGKTHTTRYLIGQMTGYTRFLLTGRSLHAIGSAAELARELQPAVVVLEDVDLVAEDRSFGPGASPVLFDLLDAMDGAAADADLLFVLTTNRADLLEPALAARPGRVDVGIEIDLPDARGPRATARALRPLGSASPHAG